MTKTSDEINHSTYLEESYKNPRIIATNSRSTEK